MSHYQCNKRGGASMPPRNCARCGANASMCDMSWAKYEAERAKVARLREALEAVEAFHRAQPDAQRLERARIETAADLLFLARAALKETS